MRINIAIIHGIGINTQGYADPLIKGIRQQFNAEVRRILNISGDFSDQLNFIPVVWDDIVAPKEACLENIFQKVFRRRKQKSIMHILIVVAALVMMYFVFNHSFIFMAGVLLLMYFAPKLIYMLRTTFAANFAGDITSYNERSAQVLILQRLNDALHSLPAAPGEENVSIISHSLGTVIASDFVWEEGKTGGLFDHKLLLSNFFTMGSPLPLFSLQFGGPDLFNKPISVQDPYGRWVNIYDIDDPIAYPLKPLNSAYDRVVLKDQEVNVGMFGIAHVKYWNDRKIQLIMAHKLVLDWLRLNNKLDKTRLDKLYADYDQNVGLKR